MFNSTPSNQARMVPGTISARGSSSLHQNPSAGGNNIANSAYDSQQMPTAAAPPPIATKSLHVHQDTYSKRDFLIDPPSFPGVQPNDLFEIYDPALPSDASKRLVIQWTGPDKDTQLKSPVQVSLANNIASKFGLIARRDAVVQRVDPSHYAAKYVELTFRDQYIGRSDMWRLRTSLVGTSVYETQKILYLGCIKAQVKEIYVGNLSVPSGYITSETRIIFRSESAKVFIFIQMSREMWEFDEDGEIFFEKVIFGFLPNLFARWRGKRDGKLELESPTNHVVSIILFSRIFYQGEEEERFRIDGYPGGQSGLQKDEEGRYYQDFYKVVIDWEARTDWTTAIIPLKEEIMRYQRDILLRPAGPYQILSGENSFAFEGNVLESVNLALNSLDKHYVDRDLQRTGLSIVMITPGSGIFDVDKKLLRLTTERMISNGIGLDMVCLSKIPAHIVPLFRWKGPVADSNGILLMNQGSSHSSSAFVPTSGGGSLMVRSASAFSRPNSRPPSVKESSAEGRPTTSWSRPFKPNTSNPQPEVQVDMSDPLYYDAPPTFPSSPTKTYYVMPHWVDCMFYVGSLEHNPQKFYTRCKMYELQMMGIMEHEISSISIPYLNESYNAQYSATFGKRLSSTDALTMTKSQLSKAIDFEKHDNDIFHDPNSPLISEIKMLNISSNQGSRSTVTDPFSLDTLDSSTVRNSTNGRRYEGYLGGTAHQSVSAHSKMTNELSRSLPRVWNIASAIPTGTIHENQSFREISAAPGRVSFSLKSANGFLEENRAVKQHDRNNGDDYDNQGDVYVQRGPQDDTIGEQPNYGRMSAQNHIDIKSKSSHIRASTDDDVGFLSSSTVKPIYISSRNYRALEDGAPSEISAADSCNTGSLSSDKGTRTFVPNPTGHGGRIIQTRHKSKQTLINPFNPPKTIIRMTSHLRRWQHAFPRVRSRSASPDLIRSEVYTDGLSNTEAWRGLMSPASLPLTTDYFPSKEELQELYSEYNHAISPSEDARSYSTDDQQRYNKAKALMKELIYHRLAQGFQLIVENSSTASKGAKITESSGAVVDKAGTTEGGSSANKRVTAGENDKQDTVGMEFPCKASGAVSGIVSSNNVKDKAYYLSMGQQVHQLSIDSISGNVEVKRYERRFGYKTENIKYQCVIWSKQLPGYSPRDLTFPYPLLSHYQWNYLDHLVSGYQEELTEELLYWRARFILTPMEHVTMNNFANPASEHLDEEEIRLAGFQRFLELFQKARYVDSKNDRSPSAASKKQDSSIKVQLITCSLAAWSFSELSKAELESSQTSSSNMSATSMPEKLTRKSRIQSIATAIQNPLTGVKLQDRRWHLRVYNSVFLGNEVVDWLINNFMDIDTREEATEFGKFLFDQGIFIHCLGKHHFMDGHYFYQFSGEYAPSGRQARGWFRNTATSLTKRDVDLDKILNKDKDSEQVSEKQARPPIKQASVSAVSTATVESSSGTSLNTPAGQGNMSQPANNGVPSFRERMEMLQKMAPPKKVEMSKAITIDVDPNKRSDRRETAILHYELAHNIKHCYHFQLHWLGCTARLIEDMLQSWGRTAERYGFRLIEVPLDQNSQSRAFNPFESPIPIKLALRPPSTKGFFEPTSLLDPTTEPVQVPKLHFFTELVKLHGFILDTESDELYPPAAQLSYSYKRAPYQNIQYVHRTGVAFIQISYSSPYEFYWVNNRLLTSHSIPTPERDHNDWERTKTAGSGQDGRSGGGSSSNKSASNHVPNPEVLRKKFAATCANVEELTRIWNEISSHLETVSGIQDILEDVPDERVVEREGMEWVMPSLAAPRPKSDTQFDLHEGVQETDNSKDGGGSSEHPATIADVPTIRIDMDPASREEDKKSAEPENQTSQ
ncbi:vacuolar membrane-associated protein iml1 [Mortierella sp. AD011]|nr:vacuolar membrane-associated protein iml1 [Mortierella sp. AD010]KAF9400718.1 vacuolar membrane-associated protein iml1 [Mortierella sp. AD011]